MASFSAVYVSISRDFDIFYKSQILEVSAACLAINFFVNLFLGHRSIMYLQSSAKVGLKV